MYVHVCICANTYLDGVWMSPWCQSYICRRVVQVGSLKILKGAAGGERERKRGRVGCRYTGGGGGGAVEQSCAEEECRLFPCVERTGEPSWLQAGAVSP